MSVFVWTRDPLLHSWTVKVSSGARPLVLTLIKMATRLMRGIASAEGCREGFNKQNKHPSNGKAASSGLEDILQYLWGFSANQIIINNKRQKQHSDYRPAPKCWQRLQIRAVGP